MSETPTGFAHPKCYLSFTKRCSHRISGEHCVSENVLNHLEPLQKTIHVGGHSWIKGDKLKKVGKSGLTAHILCAHHNSSLSEYDSAAGALVKGLMAIENEFRKPQRKPLTYMVDGPKLERWILKTIAGQLHAGQLKPGTPQAFLDNRCYSILADKESALPDEWGLYFAQQREEVLQSGRLAILPSITPSGLIGVVVIVVCGIEMRMVMDRPVRPSLLGHKRSRRLVFRDNGAPSEIIFNWGANIPGPPITFQFAGVFRKTLSALNFPEAE
jgi:hypothetical protein